MFIPAYWTSDNMTRAMKTIKWNRKYMSIITVIVVIVLTIYFMNRNVPSPEVSVRNQNMNQHIYGPQNPGDDEDGRRQFDLRADDFYLNGVKTRLLSGAIHYFRIVPEYWEDRLIKLKAAGLNTVETYVPWNKHEEIKGEYSFHGMLDLRRFVSLAHNLGLYVILRPGPYICSEWEFGGLPSWLLRDQNMQVRANYRPFLLATDKYFKELFKQIVDLQYNRGGPIIMVQIENEYGSYGDDLQYMVRLKQIMEQHGIREQLFTSDNSGGLRKMDLPNVYKTANFKQVNTGKELFRYLLANQPNRPLMVMEFWSGWFDEWNMHHHTFSTQEFHESLDFILGAGGSVNFYMFHGGTNFGFMNGQNGANPDVTSYDYDAPVSESGEITPKYHVIRELIAKHKLNKTVLPDIPPNLPKASYGTLLVDKMMYWEALLTLVQPIESSHVVTMEMLDRNKGSGQSFGFVLYRHSIPSVKEIKIQGHMNDRAQILLNGREIQLIENNFDNLATIRLDADTAMIVKEHNILDILVENTGRVTWGKGNVFNEQRKGLDGTVTADNWDLNTWKIYPLEFKTDFIQGASKSKAWQPYDSVAKAPALYRLFLNIDGSPKDTFLNMKGWNKGVVFVNGFNLGRYWHVGPTHTLYIPAPLLRSGKNQIVVLELHKPSDQIISVETPILN